jgi:hypothetical protein
MGVSRAGEAQAGSGDTSHTFDATNPLHRVQVLNRSALCVRQRVRATSSTNDAVHPLRLAGFSRPTESYVAQDAHCVDDRVLSIGTFRLSCVSLDRDQPTEGSLPVRKHRDNVERDGERLRLATSKCLGCGRPVENENHPAVIVLERNLADDWAAPDLADQWL